MVASLFALLWGATSAQHSRTAQSESVVFIHAGVIDVAADDARRALEPDQTVVIVGTRITAMGRTGRVAIPSSAVVIDATGQFLIPGLWDMHVHALNGN